MSSSTQIDRPCVPKIKSLSRGWIRMSSTGTVGRLSVSGIHVAPRVTLT